MSTPKPPVRPPRHPIDKATRKAIRKFPIDGCLFGVGVFLVLARFAGEFYQPPPLSFPGVCAAVAALASLRILLLVRDIRDTLKSATKAGERG
jgi:hypothetical protein